MRVENYEWGEMFSRWDVEKRKGFTQYYIYKEAFSVCYGENLYRRVLMRKVLAVTLDLPVPKLTVNVVVPLRRLLLPTTAVR